MKKRAQSNNLLQILLQLVWQLLFVAILLRLITHTWDRLSCNTGARILRSWILISLPIILFLFICLELFVLDGSYKIQPNIIIHATGLLLYFTIPIYLVSRQQTFQKFLWGLISTILTVTVLILGTIAYEQGLLVHFQEEWSRVSVNTVLNNLSDITLTLFVSVAFITSSLICYGVPYLTYKYEYIREVNILSKWKAETSGNNARFAGISTYKKYPKN